MLSCFVLRSLDNKAPYQTDTPAPQDTGACFALKAPFGFVLNFIYEY